MHIRKTLGLLGAMSMLSSVAATMAFVGPASAAPTHPACKPGTVWVAGDNACEPVDPPPTTAPPQVGISSVAPDYGWAGDTVTVQGTVLQGASSVTFAGVPAAFTDNGSSITATVPAGIPDQSSGPDVILITVVTPQGTATANFSVMSTVQVNKETIWTDGNPDNTATTQVTVDRSSGIGTYTTTVTTTNIVETFWVGVSVLYANSAGTMIGFSTPYDDYFSPTPGLCATGWITCSNTVRGPINVDKLQEAPLIHSIQIVQVEESSQALQATLLNLFNEGASVASVLQTLGGFI